MTIPYPSNQTLPVGTVIPPSGGAKRIDRSMPVEAVNSNAAPNAPSGVHRPKMSAASAMNPRPAVISPWNALPNSMVR